MTREEQITKFLEEVFPDAPLNVKAGFRLGVDWAESNLNWRSVNEELPPEESECLLLWDNGIKCVGYYVNNGWNTFSRRLGHEIIAWCALPDTVFKNLKYVDYDSRKRLCESKTSIGS
jgi:hypothetical protein